MTYMRAPLAPDLVGLIMVKLGMVYGKRFTNGYEASPAQVRDHWAIELAGISEAGVRYALDHLPADYVPNVLQFRMIVNQRPPEEFKALPYTSTVPSEQKQRALAAQRQLQQEFTASTTRQREEAVDLTWAERIVATPQHRSKRSIEIASEVLRRHGRLQ